MLRRGWLSLGTWPDAGGWARCAAIAVLGLGLIASVAFPAGLAHWEPNFGGWPLRLAKVMIVPAFMEEWVFRGVLIPARGGSSRPGLWIAFGLAAFVAWHIVEASTFLPSAHLFLTAPFLICALVLGAACGGMRFVTGSLWPAVIFHGLVVFFWQAALGGPDVAHLLSRG